VGLIVKEKTHEEEADPGVAVCRGVRVFYNSKAANFAVHGFIAKLFVVTCFATN
jgi:hypothetical protein